jgi:hypothetical protein
MEFSEYSGLVLVAIAAHCNQEQQNNWMYKQQIAKCL